MNKLLGTSLRLLLCLKSRLHFQQEAARAVGIVEINNYEIKNPDRLTGFRAVFPVTSVMSHSCRPNCRPVVAKSPPFVNVVVASVDIPAGEELTINYVHLDMCTRYC